MTHKPENPYVYPQAEKCGEVAIAYGGITLRDYFAAAVLPQIIAMYNIDGEIADNCYSIADAMLKARSV